MKIILNLFALTLLATVGKVSGAAAAQRPNILWLVAEDASVDWFGCYGNLQATTPNIDKLAAEGFRYTEAFASAPVCSASRTAWITGINGVSMGTYHHRSRYDIPHNLIKYYPDYLKEGGYCTINQTKTDYNIGGRPDKECWDATGKEADGWKASPGQPWFEVVNFEESHESRAQGPVTNTRHSPQDVTLAKYHPDVLEIRQNYAKYYDAVERMDSDVGKKLAELKASGQEDDTIVIFCTDHGGVLPRSKRFLFDSGTHAPLIIRIPEKFKNLWPADSPGSTVDRLVSFLDFPKTWLSITGSPIPTVMQGRIFWGPHAEAEPEYVFSSAGRMDERSDNQRSVRDKRYVYIKNYMPFVPCGQHADYLWKMTAMQAWEEADKGGKTDLVTGRFFALKPPEELYDSKADPDNLVNLVENPEYKDVLVTMRGALRDWQLTIHDAGLLPEAETDRRAVENDTTIYEMAQDRKLYDLPAYLDAADLALAGNPANRPTFLEHLKSSDSGLRYWGTVGLLTLKRDEMTAADLAVLQTLLVDPSGEIRAIAAWILIRSSEANAVMGGQECLKDLIAKPSPVRLFALNVLDWMHLDSIEFCKANLLAMKNSKKTKKSQKSDSGSSKLETAQYEGDLLRFLLESHGEKSAPAGSEHKATKGETR